VIIEIEGNPLQRERIRAASCMDGDKISSVFMRGNEKKQESVTLKTLE